MTSASRRDHGVPPSHGEPADTDAWVVALMTPQSREAAVGHLHLLLLRIARAEVSRRSGMNGIRGAELDDMAHQAADDATMSILRRVNEFRGESRFTTWAYKFVIFEVSNKIGRHVWRREGVQLDESAWDHLPERLGTGPESVAEGRALVAAVRDAVSTVLTQHQRHVFEAIVIHGTPLDTLVAELGTNRNAIYKTMFDARRKVRTFLETQGHLEPSQVRQP